MKNCIRCEKPKPLISFYKHKMMADGHLNKCKDCCKEQERERVAELSKNLDWVMAERKRCRERNARLGYTEKYRARTRAAKARLKRYHQKWLKKNEIKRAAHILLGNGLRDGKVVKGACAVCGSTEKVDGHHDDYSKPLEVRWLCPTHHKELHRKTGF